MTKLLKLDENDKRCLSAFSVRTSNGINKVFELMGQKKTLENVDETRRVGKRGVMYRTQSVYRIIYVHQPKTTKMKTI